MLMVALMVAAMFALVVASAPLFNRRSFRNNLAALSMAALCVVLASVVGGWFASAQELSALRWITALIAVPMTVWLTKRHERPGGCLLWATTWVAVGIGAFYVPESILRWTVLALVALLLFDTAVEASETPRGWRDPFPSVPYPSESVADQILTRWSHGWLLSLWHWAPRSRPLVLYQFKDVTPRRSDKIQVWHIIGEETAILRFMHDSELQRLAPGVCRVSEDGHVRYRGVYRKRFISRFRRVLRGRGAQLDVRYERPSLSDHLDFRLHHTLPGM